MSILDAWRAHHRVKELRRHLYNMSFEEERIDEEVRKAWTTYKYDASLETLRELSIDRLSENARQMPITALKRNGYLTIYDCMGKTHRDFEKIRGVGAHLAKRIVRSRDIIQKDVELKSLQINNNKIAQPLLQVLNRKSKIEMLEPVIEKFNEDKSIDLKSFNQKLNLIMMKKRIIPWLFSKDKVEINEAIDAVLSYDLDVLRTFYLDIKRELDDDLTKFNYSNDFIKNPVKYYSGLEESLGIESSRKNVHMDDDLVNLVGSQELNAKKKRPNLTVRGYQEFGAQFMIKQKKTLLGDEMGLGKTVEALVAMNHLYYNEGMRHFVVIVPLSIMTNWKREIDKWTDLEAYSFHGSSRDFEFERWVSGGGVLVTTYGVSKDIDISRIRQIDMLVADEAHYVKNPGAQRSQSVYRLVDASEYVVFMTGTPLENNVGEMRQLISVLQPEIAERIPDNIPRTKKNADLFQRLISPVYLRRNRKDVLHELPELEMVEHYVNFSEKEEAFYKRAVGEGKIMTMRQAGWYGQSRKDSPKLNALVEICDQAKAEGHNVIVFSYFRNVLNVIEKELGSRSFGQINGDVASISRQDMVDEFNLSKPGSVLLSQIVAGGEGLNIQSANIVILCEPQYKPSTEKQAISRVYRMGQKKEVIVYRILTENSVDDLIMKRIIDKTEEFDSYARDSNSANRYEQAIDSNLRQIQKDIVLIEAERYGIKLNK